MWSDCTRSDNGVWTKTRSRTCISGPSGTNSDCTETLSDDETCTFTVWHGETDVVDLKVPNACTDCGGPYTIPAWTPNMMFDDETEAPPSSYGYGADSRTAWVRKIFKFLFFMSRLQCKLVPHNMGHMIRFKWVISIV